MKRPAIFAILAIATLALNLPGLIKAAAISAEGYGSDLRPRHGAFALLRMLERDIPPGASVAFVPSGDSREESVEREAMQSIAWHSMPSATIRAPALAVTNMRFAVASKFNEEANAFLATDGRFRPIGSTEAWTLWDYSAAVTQRHDGDASAPAMPRFGAKAVARECAALLPLFCCGGLALSHGGAAGLATWALFFSLACLASAILHITTPLPAWFAAALALYASHRFAAPPGTRGKGGLHAPALSAAAFTVIAAATLSHRLAAPYGLAVSGGKAKLWLLSGGIGRDFLASEAWRLLEPAYPPGVPLMVYGAYCAGQHCGDWLIQLLPCLFAAATAGILFREARSAAAMAWVATLAVAPIQLSICGGFYPEPMMALFALCGWVRVGVGKSDGWLILGAAGWFKNEGLLLLLAAWLAVRLADGGGSAGVRDLFLAVALPVAWHVGCRLSGAHLNGFGGPECFSAMRAGESLLAFADSALLHPWRFAFAYPAAIAAWLAGQGKRPRNGLGGTLLFSAFYILLLCIVFGFSQTDLDWHLRTSVPRLLWVPAHILGYGILSMGAQSSGRGEPAKCA